MLKTLMLLAVSSGQGSAPAPQVTANGLISKMFARYANAKTITGTVTLVQSAASVAVAVESQLSIERPARVFLRQVRKSSDPFTFILSSDGKRFSYDLPEEARRFSNRPNERLVEAIEVGKNKLTVGDMYLAAAESLGDRSAPFDMAFGRIEDLRFLTTQWPSFGYQGKTKLGDVEVHVIQGAWRLNESSPTDGAFELSITEDGDLRRYITKVPTLFGKINQTVISTWNVDLVVNGKVDPAVFKVVM